MRGLLGALAAAAAAAAAAASPSGLPTVDPVAVGQVRTVGGASQGDALELRTLSLDPPVFSIPGLLSGAEADELARLAGAEGQEWLHSQAGDHVTGRMVRQLRKGGKAARRLLAQFDADSDGALNAEEVAFLAREAFQMPNFSAEDHAALLASVLGPRGLEPKRGEGFPADARLGADLVRHLAGLSQREPHRRDRYSSQTWLSYEAPLLRQLLVRAQAVTGLPAEVVNASEMLQVVRYPRLGHYSCHHDSSPDMIDAGLIRLGTLGVVLNDVAAGGETAFPGADRPGPWGGGAQACTRIID